jgi:hypothetical protein
MEAVEYLDRPVWRSAVCVDRSFREQGPYTRSRPFCANAVPVSDKHDSHPLAARGSDPRDPR